jgi:hypothetical protein
MQHGTRNGTRNPEPARHSVTAYGGSAGARARSNRHRRFAVAENPEQFRRMASPHLSHRTRNQKPETTPPKGFTTPMHPEPGTRNPKRATLSRMASPHLSHRTRNQEPETRNQKPEIIKTPALSKSSQSSPACLRWNISPVKCPQGWEKKKGLDVRALRPPPFVR